MRPKNASQKYKLFKKVEKGCKKYHFDITSNELQKYHFDITLNESQKMNRIFKLKNIRIFLFFEYKI
jgi:hypothetical protein